MTDTAPPSFIPPRERRQIRRANDRRLSIILGILIGLVIGGGAFIMARQGILTKAGPVYIEPNAIPPSAEKSSNNNFYLLSHKALYNVSLVRSKSGSQIIDIKGQMFYQSHKGCDGYVTDHRFTLTYDYADSDPLRVTSDFSTVETLDGRHFDFSSRRRRNGELYQELRGTADQTAQGGTVTYSEPNDLNFDLSPQTLFPATHTKALIEAAKSGKRFITSTIFDGSDDQGPVDVTAIISPYRNLVALPVAIKGHPSSIDTTILRSPAWKMRLAFFPKNSKTETSDYELTMILHENGVISNMSIDYSDFTVDQQIVALEPLSPDPCTDTNAPESPMAPKTPGIKPFEEIPAKKPVPDLPLR